MPRYLLIALNGPMSKEDEAEYNEWYENVHVDDLLSIDGAKSVTRYQVEAQNRMDKPYICITEFEADSIDEVRKGLGEKAAAITDKMDRSTSIFLIGREISRRQI